MKLAAIAFMLPVIFVPVQIDEPVHDPLKSALHFNQVLQAHVERQEARRAERQAERRAEAAAEASRTAARSAPAVGLPAGLLCVRKHESGGDYTIINSLGYAGAYQFSPEYWPAWAHRYGYGEWAGTHPASVPPNVQDGVALGLWNDGATVWRNWAPYDCDWP